MASVPTNDPFGVPTRWSMILGSRGKGPESERSWRELIDRYRDPIARIVRHRVADPSRCEEVTADFFAHLFERSLLASADPAVGRFRCYVQGVLRIFLLDVGRAERRIPASLTAPQETAGAAEPVPDPASVAEEDEEAEWAAGILGNALRRLAERAPEHAEILCDAYGIAPRSPISREPLARREGMTRAALDTLLHRLRLKLVELIRSEVRETVADRVDLTAEMEVVRHRLIAAHPELVIDS